MRSSHNLQFTFDFAKDVLKHLGEPGKSLAYQIEKENWPEIISGHMVNPELFTSAGAFFDAYQAYCLLRKFSAFDVKIDKPKVAFSKFVESELSCSRVNNTSTYAYDDTRPLTGQTESIKDRARHLIKKVLGRFDSDEWERSCRFSNGASTRCRRDASTVFDKLAGKPQVTLLCRDIAVYYMWSNESWRRYCQDKFGRESDPYTWVELVVGSKYTTVPKDSSTDRSICIEPDLNMFFQLGIGAMIRRRLYRIGIDLSDQSVNQRLSHIGSVDGTVATIDLKAASDSIAKRLVEDLLPETWWKAMDQTRSHYYRNPEGAYVLLEKVSSMGNGFTFELESLIFWAISKACLDVTNGTVLSVYGDDICISPCAAPILISVLRDIGFETNSQKTFLDGPFRESCGKHYFKGEDVTPFYLKDPIACDATIYHAVNSARRIVGFDPEPYIKRIPPSRRCFVPESFGLKAGIITESPRGRWDRRLYAWRFKYLRQVRSDHSMHGPTALLGSLLVSEQCGQGTHTTIKRGRGHYRVAYATSSVW